MEHRENHAMTLSFTWLQDIFPYNCDRNYRSRLFFRLHRRKYHVVEEGLAEIEMHQQLV